MRRSINIEVGEGLFTSDPVAVEIEFADHTATFFMTALTQSVVAELERQGVKWDTKNTERALQSSRKLFAKIVHGWEGFKANDVDIPFTEENRDRVAEVPEIAAEIIQIAVQLASHRLEVEEGN